MFVVFCLRLALGLIACLLLTPREVNARFIRTHFLTTLGLLTGAAAFAAGGGDVWFWSLLGVAMFLAFIASIVWHIEGNPGGRLLIFLSLAVLATLLGQRGVGSPALLADDFTSAALLGAALTAMLMGHFYLIASTMTMAPLLRLITAFTLAILARMLCAGLRFSLANHGSMDTEFLLLLGVRWVIGLIGPLALCWMAWETARIRSTQSATGILYVAVILVFLGELTSLLLAGRPGGSG